MAQPYINQAAQWLTPQGTQDFLNPYASNVMAGMKDVFGQQMSQTTGNLTQQAGGVGADRIAVGQAELAKQQQLAAGQTMANLYGQAAQQAQTSAFGTANLGTTAQNATLQGAQSLLGTGGLQQQLAQAQLNAPYQQELQRIAWPYQNVQFLGGLTAALAPGLGGTTSGTGSTTYPPQSPWGTILGLGQIGAGLAGKFAKRGGRINPYARGGFASGGDPSGDDDDISLSYSAPNVDQSNEQAESAFASQLGQTGAEAPPKMADEKLPTGLNTKPISVAPKQEIPNVDLKAIPPVVPHLNLNPPSGGSGGGGKGGGGGGKGMMGMLPMMMALERGGAVAPHHYRPRRFQDGGGLDFGSKGSYGGDPTANSFGDTGGDFTGGDSMFDPMFDPMGAANFGGGDPSSMMANFERYSQPIKFDTPGADSAAPGANDLASNAQVAQAGGESPAQAAAKAMFDKSQTMAARSSPFNDRFWGPSVKQDTGALTASDLQRYGQEGRPWFDRTLKGDRLDSVIGQNAGAGDTVPPTQGSPFAHSKAYQDAQGVLDAGRADFMRSVQTRTPAAESIQRQGANPLTPIDNVPATQDLASSGFRAAPMQSPAAPYASQPPLTAQDAQRLQQTALARLQTGGEQFPANPYSAVASRVPEFPTGPGTSPTAFNNLPPTYPGATQVAQGPNVDARSNITDNVEAAKNARALGYDETQPKPPAPAQDAIMRAADRKPPTSDSATAPQTEEEQLADLKKKISLKRAQNEWEGLNKKRYADDPWMALVRSGFATMAAAGRRDARGLPLSPWAAVGEGGVEGMKMLEGQAERAQKDETIAQASERLDQAARFHNDQYTKMTPFQKAQQERWGQEQAEKKREFDVRQQELQRPIPFVDGNGEQKFLIYDKNGNRQVVTPEELATIQQASPQQTQQQPPAQSSQQPPLPPQTRQQSPEPPPVPQVAPTQTAPSQTAPVQAPPATEGVVKQNTQTVAAGPFNYARDTPYIEKGMEVPEPRPIAGRSADALKRDAEYYLQTGKLPQLGSGQAGRVNQIYRGAVQNYAAATAQSRGLTPQETAEMWRTAPGMLRFILGPDGRATVALGTAVRHLDTVKQLAQAWAAKDVQTVNRITAVLSREFGGVGATNLDTAGSIVGPEIIKAIGVAGAGTFEEREKAASAFSVAKTPAQLLGAVDVTQRLLGGQLEGRARQAAAAGVSPERFRSLIGDRPYEILQKGEAAAAAPGAGAPKAPAKLPFITQRGHTYKLQPDGSYLPVQ